MCIVPWGNISLDTFQTFAYVSIYLQTKTLHENHIVQYLQNYKYQDVEDIYKLLQTPCKTLLTFKSIKLHFLELAL